MAKLLTRKEYEDKVLKHLDAIRKLAEKYDPKIEQISMAVVGGSEWMLSYIGKGDESVKVVDVFYHFANDDEFGPYINRDGTYERLKKSDDQQ